MGLCKYYQSQHALFCPFENPSGPLCNNRGRYENNCQASCTLTARTQEKNARAKKPTLQMLAYFSRTLFSDSNDHLARALLSRRKN